MNNDYIYRSFTKAELVQRCIDLGINRVAMLAERSRLRAELAEANDYINRLRGMLTDSHPCIDPSRDACNCILCELVSRERQQAALDKEE